MLLFFFLLTATISVKLLAFDVYKIPSSSMENLLYHRDVIVVNKLQYGPKLPRSPFEIPLVNLAFYMNKDARLKINETWWDYSRWNGFSSIKQGDVFVFSSNWDKNYILVKRCVGLPGDTIIIKKGEVYANSKVFNSPETVKNNYSFRIKNKVMFYEIIDSLALNGSINYYDKYIYKGSTLFSKKEIDLLQKRNCIDSVNKILALYVNSNQKLLKTPTSHWTLDDMGSIVIPKKGMEIKLNLENLMLYRDVISRFEKSKLTRNNGEFFINGKRTLTYTFKLNYYFMMGDNRKGTSDSRCRGFLPETNIIGKVQYVLLSNKNEEFQWNKVFRMI